MRILGKAVETMIYTGMRILGGIALSAAWLGAQETAEEALNQGIRYMKFDRYKEAVEALERAASLAPENRQAHLHLGMALVKIALTEGGEDAENRGIGELQRVLAADPNNKEAIASIAFLHRSKGMMLYVAHRDAGQRLGEAQRWYERLLKVDPGDKKAANSIGLIAILRVSQEVTKEQQRLGVKEDDPGPLPDGMARRSLRERFWEVMERGVAALEQTLRVDAENTEAMLHLGQLSRLRSYLRETREESLQDLEMAKKWSWQVDQVLKMQAKRRATEDGKGTQAKPVVPQRLRVGPAAQASRLKRSVAPGYPDGAKESGVEGKVTLQVTVAKDGHVTDVEVIGGHPLLARAAIEAVKQWVYEPMLLSGGPVEVTTQVEVNFRLP